MMMMRSLTRRAPFGLAPPQLSLNGGWAGRLPAGFSLCRSEIRMMRKSLTFVPLGPGANPSAISKNALAASLVAKASSRLKPAARTRAAVSPKTKAPHAPELPSTPSLSPASAATPWTPSMARARAAAYSKLGPPRPRPLNSDRELPPGDQRVASPPGCNSSWRSPRDAPQELWPPLAGSRRGPLVDSRPPPAASRIAARLRAAPAMTLNVERASRGSPGLQLSDHPLAGGGMP